MLVVEEIAGKIIDKAVGQKRIEKSTLRVLKQIILSCDHGHDWSESALEQELGQSITLAQLAVQFPDEAETLLESGLGKNFFIITLNDVIRAFIGPAHLRIIKKLREKENHGITFGDRYKFVKNNRPMELSFAQYLVSHLLLPCHYNQVQDKVFYPARMDDRIVEIVFVGIDVRDSRSTPVLHLGTTIKFQCDRMFLNGLTNRLNNDLLFREVMDWLRQNKQTQIDFSPHRA